MAKTRRSKRGGARKRRNPRKVRQETARDWRLVEREDAGQRGSRQIKNSARAGASHKPAPATTATIGRADYGDLVPHKHGGVIDRKQDVWPKDAMQNEMTPD